MNKCIFVCFALMCSLAVFPGLTEGQSQVTKKKIFLIGMKTDHKAGEHEYVPGLRLLEECLNQTPGLEVKMIRVEWKSKGWPEEAKGIEDASAIVSYCRDGGTHFLLDPDRKTSLETILKKGAGFMALHWAVEGPKKIGDPYMAILGGYYEPKFSTNPHNTATVKPADAKHPISRGWKPFEARDEFYFKMRFLPDVKPIMLAEALTDYDKSVHKDAVIAWAFERKDSKGPLGPGRSFGFTGGHFHYNWGIQDFRRMVVNAILWTADVEIPEGGAPVVLNAPVPKIPDKK